MTLHPKQQPCLMVVMLCPRTFQNTTCVACCMLLLCLAGTAATTHAHVARSAAAALVASMPSADWTISIPAPHATSSITQPQPLRLLRHPPQAPPLRRLRPPPRRLTCPQLAVFTRSPLATHATLIQLHCLAATPMARQRDAYLCAHSITRT